MNLFSKQESICIFILTKRYANVIKKIIHKQNRQQSQTQQVKNIGTHNKKTLRVLRLTKLYDERLS